MGIGTKIVKEVAKRVVPRLVPKEGELKNGTLNGEAARQYQQREQGMKRAKEIEKANRRNRTG